MFNGSTKDDSISCSVYYSDFTQDCEVKTRVASREELKRRLKVWAPESILPEEWDDE